MTTSAERMRAWTGPAILSFGYLGAVMAGSLLTAVPNWTGSLPLIGWPLAGLVALWVIGRGRSRCRRT
jgi:uncharacterized protein involved in response to NO